MKIAISGAGGNLGQHILKNTEGLVTKIGRNDWESELFGHDVFIHCAYDLKKKITEEPEEVLESNILSVMKALNLCRKYKISKFIFISSCSVYGHSSKCSEQLDVVPVSINGYTKLLCEKIITEFCSENNIKCLILRVFNAFGGNDEFSVVSKMRRAIDGEGFYLCNNGEAERDYIHVNDVARVVCHYAINDSKYSIINVGTGRTRKIKNILSAMQISIGNIQVIHIDNRNEVSYSRADNFRLIDDMGSIKFVDIFDYIKGIKT